MQTEYTADNNRVLGRGLGFSLNYSPIFDSIEKKL